HRGAPVHCDHRRDPRAGRLGAARTGRAERGGGHRDGRGGGERRGAPGRDRPRAGEPPGGQRGRRGAGGGKQEGGVVEGHCSQALATRAIAASEKSAGAQGRPASASLPLAQGGTSRTPAPTSSRDSPPSSASETRASPTR